MPKYKPNGAAALAGGVSWKRRLRMEKVARLMLLGIKDKDISSHIGITPAALSVLKSTPLFQRIMVEVTTGILSQETQQVARTREYQIEELTDMVPQALDNLRKFTYHPKAEIALKASLEILDRQGDHAKVSKTNVHVEQTFDFTNVNNIGNNIMAVLKGNAPDCIPAPANVPPTLQAADINIDTAKISSESVQVPQDEGDAITRALREFSKSAEDSKSQVLRMAEIVDEKTLEEIDSATEAIQ